LYLTTGDQNKRFSRETDIAVTEPDKAPLPTIHIFPEERLQQIDGFGAALTGSSAFLFHHKLPAAPQAALLEELFSDERGIGLSYIRMTMGASDFSLTNYTYNDLSIGEADYTMSRFSLGKDKEDVLPMVRNIIRINPDIRIMASPWSAPAWMK